MKNEEKTKEELISELNILRKEYTELKKHLSKSQKPELIPDTKTNPGTETILVVDDNKHTRAVIVEMLQRKGYNLLEAESSQKAIEVFKSHSKTIHMVLSDVVMPEINGPEMVKKILVLQPEIKIIFMSGYVEEEIVHEEVFKIVHSHTPFIGKPFSFDEINPMIRQLLDK